MRNNLVASESEGRAYKAGVNDTVTSMTEKRVLLG